MVVPTVHVNTGAMPSSLANIHQRSEKTSARFKFALQLGAVICHCSDQRKIGRIIIKGLWELMPSFILGALNAMPGTAATQRISKVHALTP